MRSVVEIRQPILLRLYVGAFAMLWCGVLLGAVLTAFNVIPLFMLAFGLTFMYRMFSLAVVADESGLLVRNNFRTRRFRWDEVEDFRIGGPMMNMPFGKVIHVLLHNGEIMTLDVTMRPWILGGGRAKLEHHLRELKAWVGRDV